MIILEFLIGSVVLLGLLYFMFFSPKCDRIMKRLFSKNAESADGIAEQVRDIEAEKSAAKAAIAARDAALKAEAAKLSKINVK